MLKQPIGFEYKYYSHFRVLAVLYFEILVTIWNDEKWSLIFFGGGNERVITAPSGTNIAGECNKGTKRRGDVDVDDTSYRSDVKKIRL